MPQKLILPLGRAKLTASWKTAAYTARHGIVHYGCDLISTIYDRTVYASGEGRVVARGRDGVVGNVVVVRYLLARNRVTGRAQDILLRYFHLDTVAVVQGEPVTKDTVLGRYGSSGLFGAAPTLHMEADTDTARPLHSPTIAGGGFLKGRSMGATDTTMTSPIEWLHCKASHPDLQTYATAGDRYIAAADKVMEIIR